ncbi:MAG: serine/threonine-protein kinase [Kofleriaceae bacterium]
MICPADGTPLGSTAAADDDEQLVPGTLIGEYKIERLLGAGGMGEVYGAFQPVIDKRVAIKVMSRACSSNPINLERFVHEAKAVNAIGHANIVDIFSFGQTSDGRCYFVMEWLRGESLRDRLDREPLAPTRCYEILDTVLRALEAAHAVGIVHRDLKPDNIFLVAAKDGEPERVKLLDFGIAKLSGGGTSNRARKTQTGTVVGTPAYMAPEQAAGLLVEGPSDIYSLGVVAYEMATGRVPFDAESTVQVMASHVAEPPPLPSTHRAVPSAFEALILSMLEKQPADRPTPAAVRASLIELRADDAAIEVMVTPPIGDGSAIRRDAKTTPMTPMSVAKLAPASGTLAVTSTSVSAAHDEARPSSKRWWMIVAGTVVIAITAMVVMNDGAHRVASDALPSHPAPPVPPVAAIDPAEAPPAAPVVAPAPASPARAARGSLVIITSPRDAAVELDGTRLPVVAGKLERALEPGNHRVVVSRAGYQTVERTIAIEAAINHDWNVTLVRASRRRAPVTTPPPATAPAPIPAPVPRSDTDSVRDPFADSGGSR